jgi:hypothetical protein
VPNQNRLNKSRSVEFKTGEFCLEISIGFGQETGAAHGNLGPVRFKKIFTTTG